MQPADIYRPPLTRPGDRLAQALAQLGRGQRVLGSIVNGGSSLFSLPVVDTTTFSAGDPDRLVIDATDHYVYRDNGSSWESPAATQAGDIATLQTSVTALQTSDASQNTSITNLSNSLTSLLGKLNDAKVDANDTGTTDTANSSTWGSTANSPVISDPGSGTWIVLYGGQMTVPAFGYGAMGLSVNGATPDHYVFTDCASVGHNMGGGFCGIASVTLSSSDDLYVLVRGDGTHDVTFQGLFLACLRISF
jgi:hypothetical protein